MEEIILFSFENNDNKYIFCFEFDHQQTTSNYNKCFIINFFLKTKNKNEREKFTTFLKTPQSISLISLKRIFIHMTKPTVPQLILIKEDFFFIGEIKIDIFEHGEKFILFIFNIDKQVFSSLINIFKILI